MARMLATVLLALFAGVSFAAPIQQLIPANSRQLLILSPEAQLQLSPAFKLQTPIIQPLTPIGRIQTGNGETIVFYPTILGDGGSGGGGFPGFPVDGDTFINQIIQIIQMLGSGGGGGGGSGDGDDRQSGALSLIFPQQQLSKDAVVQKADKIELNPDAEMVSQEGLTPASTVSKTPNNRKFYTVGGAPQFFGNFDFLQNPVHPIFSLQPLESIKARSMADPEKVTVEKDVEKVEDIQPIDLSLRTNIPEGEGDVLQETPGLAARSFAQFLVEQKVLQPDRVVDNNAPGVKAQEFIQLLESQKILQPDRVVDNNVSGVKAQEFIQLLGSQAAAATSTGINSPSEKIKVEAEQANEGVPLQVSEDQSIAQARPVAIAITGKGGLAQSAPIGTAIVGEDGYALSSPSATAIAGDFGSLSGSGVDENKLRKH